MKARPSNPSMCPLDIRLLGPFDVRLNGGPLPYLRTRKRQWLLALLALRHDRQVDRDWLAGTLWPESETSQALYNLRRCLSDLRSALGTQGDRLTSLSARTVCLSLKEAMLDVSAFDAAIARGDVASLEAAVSLYRGPLLEGCTEEWIFAERQEREQAYLSALEILAAQAMARHDPNAAARYLRFVIATDPLRETAQRSLLEALAAGGDLAAATHAYREYRLYLYRTLHTEPAPETSALFQQIRSRAQDSPQKETPSASQHAVSSLPGRLPLPLTGFVGRQQELTEITGLLASTRLVTLLGPGGVGKTRLAIQLAQRLAGEYPEGAWFVDLSSLLETTQIPQAIASMLGVREERERPLLDALSEHLREKRMLLVLDNFEHLVETGPGIVRRLLERASGLTCLVTSRQKLGVEGECEFAVKPLLTPGLPGTPERLLEFESVQLFVERAKTARADFRLTEANASVVAAICHRLEGIPLAIELAAARASVLTPAQMLVQLERRLDFLKSRRRDMADRHLSLRAAIDASYLRLPTPLQRFFCQLSVFQGGWTLEAAEAVCGADGGVGRVAPSGQALGVGDENCPNAQRLTPNASEVLDYLEALREASLVLAEVEADSAEIRFRMLDTLREYAEEKLKPEWAAGLRDRHANYFLTLTEAAEEAFDRGEQAQWLQRLEQEHDNLRAALHRCLEDDSGDALQSLRLVAGLFRFWRHRGHWSEGRAFCERALAQTGAQERTRWRAKALYAAGYLAADQGDYDAAKARYELSLAISQEIGDRRGIARPLSELGRIAHKSGELESAQALYTQSLHMQRELGNKPGIAAALNDLGLILANQGQREEARRLYEEARAIYREAGYPAREAISLNHLGNLLLDQGRYDEARTLFEQCLLLHRDLEDKSAIAASLNNLGNAAANLGDAAARVYYEESLSLNRELGNRYGMAIVLVNLGSHLFNREDYASARDYLEECLTLCRQLDARWVAAGALESMATLAGAQRQPERAVRLFAAAAALRVAISSPNPPQVQEEHNRTLVALREDLGEEAFTVAWDVGAAMTIEQAIAAALAGETDSSSDAAREPEPPVRPAQR